MKNRQLTFAREYRGYSQSKLASEVPGLSQSNLSKFEKGLGPLSEELIRRIMNVLDFPIEFLNLSFTTTEDGHYRKKSSIKASIRNQIRSFRKLIAHTMDCVAEEIEFPEFKFKYIDIDSYGTTPEEIAQIVRRQFKLGDTPIKDIFGFLESNGIITYQWDCDIDDFDGVSLVTDKGYHLIIVNRNMSNDRVRFTLAHELGHIIMHQSLDFIIPENRNKEIEAHKFAAEFLMPEKAIRPYLTKVTINGLILIKKYWLTSMAALLHRAKELHLIDDKRHKYLLIELSRNGWRSKEPVSVYIDRPKAIEMASNLLRNELSYQYEDIAKATALPVDIVDKIFNINSRPKIIFGLT